MLGTQFKMWNNQAIVILTILPLLQCQLYFPDDNTGGFVQAQSAPQNSTSAAAAPVAPPVVNLTELRGTTVYEQFVDKIIASGILKLALDVQKALTASSPTDPHNIVYSPINIAETLGLVLLGSNGKTFQEVATIMGLATGIDIHNNSLLVHQQFGRMLKELQSTTGFDIGREVDFATAIFVQKSYPIRQVYKVTAEAVYDSKVLNVDFANDPPTALQVVNSWVSEKTNGKIKMILDRMPPESTKVILASAMYFKAEWKRPFFDGATHRRPFYTNGRRAKSDVNVDMMFNIGFYPYYKDRTLNCEIIGFPYKGNQTTMYVVVPHDSNKEKLQELEANLTNSEIERLVSNVEYISATVYFPKMQIDTTINLEKALYKLGLKSLFKPAQSNLALLSPGIAAPPESPIMGNYLQNPISLNKTDGTILNKNREGANCTQIFYANSSLGTCEEVINATQQTVTYKKFGNKVGRRIDGKVAPSFSKNLDDIRQFINQQSNPEEFQNPRLYASEVIHKVFMDITESGTEAAAATAVTLIRSGGFVQLKIDVPFFFFIMHEETKALLFWGSVKTPTPNFK